MRHLLIAATALFTLPQTAAAGERGKPFLTLACPAKGDVTRSFDLSTGTAPWIASGPGEPGGAATAIDEATIPPGLTARLPGARWVQALPQARAASHPPGDYTFTLEFDLPKAKRRPRLRLEGELAGDEGFSLTLLEPSAPGTFVGGGDGTADDSPGVVPQAEVYPLLLDTSADQTGRPLGARSGRYVLQIALSNSVAGNPHLALLARLKLTMRCGKQR